MRKTFIKTLLGSIALGLIACDNPRAVAGESGASIKNLVQDAALTKEVLEPSFALQSLVAHDGEIAVDWTEAKDAADYSILMGASATELMPFSETKSTRVIIGNLSNGTAYFFRIVARDSNAKELGFVLASGIPAAGSKGLKLNSDSVSGDSPRQ